MSIRLTAFSLKVFIFIFVVLGAVAKSGADASGDPGRVVLIRINGTINPATVDYIRDGIELAQRSSAEALIIELDTPGGLLASTKDIVKMILNSPVAVVVYVSPSGATATSAGVFVTLSANVAAMADGTSIGAAHPVVIGGEEKRGREEDGKEGKGEDRRRIFRTQEEIMGEKMENYASSFIESIAEKRKRNAKWAIEAVRKSASITSTEALNKNVIDLVSPSLGDLLEKIDGREVELPEGKKTLKTRGAVVDRLDMNLKQRFVDTLSNPNIAFLLLSLGSLGLTMEIFKPGLIFPGVVGAISFIMGCVSLQILPFNYAGLALLVLAISLFVAELYVTSYGLLALAGIVSFAIGGILLFRTPESDLGVGFDVVLSMALVLGIFFILVAYFLIKAQRLAPATGVEALIGQHGYAVTEVGTSGKVFVSGEYWDAESEEPISKGERIEVLALEEGMRLKVKRA
jgi:membrane-bound serine protease (ClpP class)